MPSGRAHSQATAIITIASASLALFYAAYWPEVWMIPLGCAVGLIVTPDLDVRTSPVAAHRNLGQLSKFLTRQQYGDGCLFRPWYWFWWPYSRLIPYHRHWLSHGPIIGTFLRLLYLSIFTGAILFVGRWALSPLFWWFAIGLLISDLLHLFMDLSWPPRRFVISLRSAWRFLRHK